MVGATPLDINGEQIGSYGAELGDEIPRNGVRDHDNQGKHHDGGNQSSPLGQRSEKSRGIKPSPHG